MSQRAGGGGAGGAQQQHAKGVAITLELLRLVATGVVVNSPRAHLSAARKFQVAPGFAVAPQRCSRWARRASGTPNEGPNLQLQPPWLPMLRRQVAQRAAHAN